MVESGPDPKKISPPLLRRENGDSRSNGNIKSLKPPKGVSRASAEYTILSKIYSLSIQSQGRDAGAVAAAILEHYNTKKSPEDVEVIIQKYIDSDYIELVENSAGTFDIFVNTALVNGRAIESLKFDYDRRITIEVDSKDMMSFAMEDLILTRILQMETYKSSGVPQNKALKDFILLSGRETRKSIDEILANLREEGYIEPNGDNSMHLSDEGFQHIILTLHKEGSLLISDTLPTGQGQLEDEIDTESIEAAYRDMGAVILSRPKHPLDTSNHMMTHEIVGSHVPPQDILSDATMALIEQVEFALEDPLYDIDKSQVLLSMGNKQEAESLVVKIRSLLNQASPQPVGEWHIGAYLTDQTRGHIPLSFVRQMPYDVEAMVGSRGQIAHGYELKVIGNSVAINFSKDLTIGDVMSIASLSRKLEDINIETQRRFENPIGEFRRASIINNGINGVVYIGNGNIALFPGLMKSAHLLAETE